MNLKWHAFFWLLHRELSLGQRRFWGEVIDAMISFCVSTTVFGHLFPASDDKGFGPFMMVGSITTYGLFRTAWKAMVLANEMRQGKIAVQLVMSLPTRYVLAVRAISWAIWDGVLMLVGMGIGKLILPHAFSFSAVNWWKVVPMYMTVNLFYGFFALWIASLLGGLVNSVWIYPRVINPLYMFGCSYYTWYTLHANYYYLSFVHLLNPVVYCIEGMRATMLSTHQFLPMEACCAVLWMWIMLFFWHSIRRFQKKFDLH